MFQKKRSIAVWSTYVCGFAYKTGPKCSCISEANVGMGLTKCVLHMIACVMSFTLTFKSCPEMQRL
jgi:hypothetical protein